MSGLALLLPAGLIALISVPLVVLFHMRSPTPKAIPVPAIRFWRVAAPKPTDEPRFQRPPISASMLLHIAAALLLSLALARPVSSLALGVVSSSSQPRHLIVMLDGSTSMMATDDGQTRFDAARKQAINRLGSIHAGDAVTVLLLGQRVATFSASDTGSLQALKERISSIEPPGGITDLTSAMLLAHDLRIPGMENSIVLLSDGALEVDPTAVTDAGMPIDYVQVGNPIDGNLAVIDISTRANPANLSEQQIFGRLANFSDKAVTVPVQYWADGFMISGENVELGANSRKDLSFTAPPDSTEAEIKVAATDAQPIDDRASIALGAGDTLSLNVLIFSDHPESLLRGFSSIPGAQVTVEITDAVAQGYGTGGFDLVVYDQVAPSKAPLVPSLFIEPPGSTFFPSPEMLSDPTPITMVQTDPLLNGVDFIGVTFGATPKYQLPAEFTSVVSAAGGGPLLAYGTLPGSESPTVLLAGSLDDSNLWQRIAFPILMTNIAEKLSPSPAPVTLSLGEPLTISPRAGSTSVTITNPAGEATTIPVPDTEGLPQGARQVAYGQTNEVGAYRLREVDAQDQTLVTGMVMVNAGNSTESNLRANPDLGSLLDQASGVAESAAKNDLESDLWPLLALLALGLLMIDWMLSLRMPRISKQLAQRKGGAA